MRLVNSHLELISLTIRVIDPVDISMLFGSVRISMPCFVNTGRGFSLLTFWGAVDVDLEGMGILRRLRANREVKYLSISNQ